MMKKALVAIAILLLSTITLCAADTTDITDLRAIPSDPVVKTNFEIYARAVDEDGMTEMRLYTDGDLTDSTDCNYRSTCSTHFDVYETDSGYHTYRLRAYGVNGNTTETRSKEISVYVSPNANDLPQVTAYVSPSQPQTGQAFTIYATSYDPDGIYQMELWHGGSVIGTQYCSYISPCSRSFAVPPKYTSSTYEFTVKAYDQNDDLGSTTLSVYVGQSSYCGDGVCSNGETCSTCPTDCGACPIQPYCGDRVCNNGETCSTCPTDCGACPVQQYCGDGTCSSAESCSTCPQDCGTCKIPLPVVIYTCKQRGGQCCDHGGTGVVNGAADCPATCFSQCNPEPAATPGTANPAPITPSGAAIAVDSSTLVLGLMFVIVVLLIALLVRK